MTNNRVRRTLVMSLIALMALGTAEALLTVLPELPPFAGVGLRRWGTVDNLALPLASITSSGELVGTHWLLSRHRATMHTFDDGNQLWEATLIGKTAWGFAAFAPSTGRMVAVYSDTPNGSLLYLQAWDPSSQVPLWTRQIGVALVHYFDPSLAISADGSLVAYAHRQLGAGTKELFLFDGLTGATLHTSQLPSNPSIAINGVEISADASRIGVGLGDRALIYDDNGNLLAQFLDGHCCHSQAFSSDGSKFLLREFGGDLSVHRWNGEAYVLDRTMNLGNKGSRVAVISDDGLTVAAYAGRFEQVAGDWTCTDNEVRVFKTVSVGFAQVSYSSSYTGYGDHACPQWMAITPDGSRVAVATWGTKENVPGPTDVLYDLATVLDTTSPVQAVPLFRVIDDINERGSAFRIDLSDDGKRVVVSLGDCHPETLCFGGGALHAFEILV